MKRVIGSMFMVCALVASAVADDKSVVEEAGKKSTAAAAKKEVKGTSVKNDSKRKKAEPPSAKSAAGTKRSGPNSCDVKLDNRTDLKIQIFIDGDFQGMLLPWGDAVRYDVLSGTTKLFGRADFTDGSVVTFGPRFFDCTAYSTYTWKLTD